MKSRVLDVMGDVLGLVKKSDLGGATALLRKALSGETAPEDEAAIRKRPLTVHRRRLFRCRRGAHWARLCALFAPGRSCRPACQRRPSLRQRRISANDF